jgi:hypothetical protein
MLKNAIRSQAQAFLSLRKKLCLVLLCAIQIVCAQSFFISGKISDNTTRKPIKAAQITLLAADGVSAKAAIASNEDGKFALNGLSPSSYLLRITCVGYKPMTLTIAELNKDTDLGELLLKPDTVQLDEVMVSANLQKKADRWVFYPSDAIKRQSTDAYDVLQRMALPDLQFDLMNRTLSSQKGGALQIRINGVPSNHSDLAALQPQDIARVEYIDNPGIVYGDGVAAVLLVHTKRGYEGMQGGVQIANALTAKQGNAYAYFKLIGLKNQLSIKATSHYKNVGGVFTNSNKTFRYPTSDMTLNAQGDDRTYRLRGGSIQLEYNRLLDERNSFFNVMANYTTSYRPENVSASRIQHNDAPFFYEELLTKDKTHNVSLDLYLDKQFASKANLLANLTVTYIGSDYHRAYNKVYHAAAQPAFTNAYDVDGQHKSIIGEIVFKQPLSKRHNLSLGTYNRLSDTRNTYEATNGTSPTSLFNFNNYDYIELSGTLGKLNYSVGGGYSFYRTKNDSLMANYHFFRPSLTLSYSLSKAFRLQYYLGINPVEPQLAMLSSFVQTQSEYELRKGNPHLKPYQAYINQLSLSFRKHETTASISTYIQYSRHPFTNNPPTYDAAANMFVYTLANQHSFTHFQVRLNASQSLFSQAFKLFGWLTLNRYINNGLSFFTTYTDIIGGLSLTYDHTKWGMQANFCSAITTMFNETKTRTAPTLQLSTYYNIRRLRFTLSVNNPFMSVATTVSTLNSELVSSTSHVFQKYNDNLVQLSLSYHFRKGKTRNLQKQMDNADNDAGVVK